MSSPDSTTPPPAASAIPSTNRPRIGDTVLVCLLRGIYRPLMVTRACVVPIHQIGLPGPQEEFRLSGVIFCEPEDHNTDALRGGAERPHDPARIHGRPDRLTPYAYAEALAPGDGIGQWRRMQEVIA